MVFRVPTHFIWTLFCSNRPAIAPHGIAGQVVQEEEGDRLSCPGTFSDGLVSFNDESVGFLPAMFRHRTPFVAIGRLGVHFVNRGRGAYLAYHMPQSPARCITAPRSRTPENEPARGTLPVDMTRSAMTDGPGDKMWGFAHKDLRLISSHRLGPLSLSTSTSSNHTSGCPHGGSTRVMSALLLFCSPMPQALIPPRTTSSPSLKDGALALVRGVHTLRAAQDPFSDFAQTWLDPSIASPGPGIM